jgi:hypothetical protein
MQESLPTPEGADRPLLSKLFADFDAPLTAAIVDALERLESGAIDASHQILFIREIGA